MKGKSHRKDVQVFERHLEDNLFQLRDELLEGSYRHDAYHEFHIFDPKHRVIHKATVRDRVIHHFVYAQLLSVFEPSFIFDSFPCRDEKGTHAAVRRLKEFTRKVGKNYRKSCWALQFDDAVILGETREEFAELVAWIEAWLWQHRRLTLHPRKFTIRKLQQGIHFLGYVTLPYHQRLRTRTRRRMMHRVTAENASSYFGLLEHRDAYELRAHLAMRLYGIL